MARSLSQEDASDREFSFCREHRLKGSTLEPRAASRRRTETGTIKTASYIVAGLRHKAQFELEQMETKPRTKTCTVLPATYGSCHCDSPKSPTGLCQSDHRGVRAFGQEAKQAMQSYSSCSARLRCLPWSWLSREAYMPWRTADRR